MPTASEPSLAGLASSLEAGHSLSAEEATAAARLLAASGPAEQDKARFLLALHAGGESDEVIAAFAAEFRSRARNPGLEAWADRAIDVCGTGGDHAGTFNVSTAVTFVLAAAGVPVLKHGNRSITSRVGGADLLAHLGVPVEASDARHRAAVSALGFTFLFAPAFHPAFREIMPVRKALAAQGRRSIFNILGPLLNPARPAHQLMGVFAEAWVPVLARSFGRLGVAAGLVVHGRGVGPAGLDELSSAGSNRVAGFGRLHGLEGDWEPEQAGLARCAASELAGGEAAHNAALLRELFSGKAPRGLEDTVCYNAAAGLLIVGRVADLRTGVGAARDMVRGGAAAQLVARTREFHADFKEP